MKSAVTKSFLVAEILLVIVGAVFVLGLSPIGDIFELLIWVGLALIYLTGGGVAIWQSATRADRTGADEDESDDVGWPAWITGIAPYITSLVGVTAAFISATVKATPDLEDAVRIAYNILAPAAMIASWAILQVGLARQYQRSWYDEGGLAFPETPKPRFSDFTYFAFTIGTAFAVSDVHVLTRRMRMRVLLHTVWSFLYNAAIVAMAISILTGR